MINISIMIPTTISTISFMILIVSIIMDDDSLLLSITVTVSKNC